MDKNGWGEGIRTPDQLINSQLRYRCATPQLILSKPIYACFISKCLEKLALRKRIRERIKCDFVRF